MVSVDSCAPKKNSCNARRYVSLAVSSQMNRKSNILQMMFVPVMMNRLESTSYFLIAHANTINYAVYLAKRSRFINFVKLMVNELNNSMENQSRTVPYCLIQYILLPRWILCSHAYLEIDLLDNWVVSVRSGFRRNNRWWGIFDDNKRPFLFKISTNNIWSFCNKIICNKHTFVHFMSSDFNLYLSEYLWCSTSVRL